MKRLLLYLLTNLAILAMLSLIARVTGLDLWLARQGSSLGSLLAGAALLGIGGSLIALALSRWIAVRVVGARIIEVPVTPREQWLLETVRALAQRARVGVPEVGVFESAQPNAFATGATRERALLAVSSGLLARMRPEELEAVLSHEISHVANGDMVTLGLIQGIVNSFVIILSRSVGNIVDRSLTRDEDGHGPAGLVAGLLTQFVLGVLAILIVMRFSRRREFRADAGAARLAGRERMIAALELLQQAHGEPLPEPLRAFGTAGAEGAGWRRLFASHPPTGERIAALRALA